MNSIILFGGGDGGGWYIGTDGKIHRIPPWNPESELANIVSVLTTAGELTQEAGSVSNRELGESMLHLAQHMAQHASAQLGQVLGVRAQEH